MKTTLFHIAFFVLTSLSSLAQMQPFALQDVQLTGGPFKNAQDIDQRYIMALDPDKLLDLFQSGIRRAESPVETTGN